MVHERPKLLKHENQEFGMLCRSLRARVDRARDCIVTRCDPFDACWKSSGMIHESLRLVNDEKGGLKKPTMVVGYNWFTTQLYTIFIVVNDG